MDDKKQVNDENVKVESTSNNEEKKVIAPNLKEVLDKIEKNKTLTSEQIKILQEEAKNSLEFMQLIEKIELPKDNYVIFTDGDEQLIYENGEFFIACTTDSTKEKKKKKRLEAKDMYIEYFIRYTLNKVNSKPTKNVEKVKSKEKVKAKTVTQEKEATKDEVVKNEVVENIVEKTNEESSKRSEKDMKRAEEIENSLKEMVTSLDDEYERNRIIDKIKKGNEKIEKTEKTEKVR